MNQIIQKMKSALETYLKAATDTIKTLERMRKEILPEIAAERSEKLYQDLSGIRYKAKEQIRAAAAEGRESVDKWGTLSGSELTDDAKLLQTGLLLTQKDFDDLCIRYKNNGSMSRLLAQYADSQNRTVIPSDPERITETFADQAALNHVLRTDKLMTIEKKKALWDRLESSAQTILAAIDGSGVGKGIDDYSVIFSVEHFGDNVEV